MGVDGTITLSGHELFLAIVIDQLTKEVHDADDAMHKDVLDQYGDDKEVDDVFSGDGHINFLVFC